MKTKVFVVMLTVMLAAVLLTAPLMAQTTEIYSTFGPGDSYDSIGGGYFIGPYVYDDLIGRQNIAVQFTPSEDYIFDSASFAFNGGNTFFNPTEVFDIRLVEDIQDIDSTLEVFSVPVSARYSAPEIYRILSIEHPLLKAGSTYYLVVSNNNGHYYSGFSGGWMKNNQNYLGLWYGLPGPPFLNTDLYLPDHPEYIFLTPAFRVEGMPATPQNFTELLLNDIETLLDAGTLTQNQAVGLSDKLEAAIVKLDFGNTRPARNQLSAFINQVNAFVRARKLTPEEGQALIDAANAILIRIGR
jgi:hypothetical protein